VGTFPSASTSAASSGSPEPEPFAVAREPEFVDEPAGVDRAVRDPGVVGVAHEVVHPVHVEFARHEGAERALARDQGGDALRVQPAAFEDPTHLAVGVGQELRDVVVVASRRSPDDPLVWCP